MGSAAARAGEKKPGFSEATAVAASAKFNFKPSRRVNMQVSLEVIGMRAWTREAAVPHASLEDNPKMLQPFWGGSGGTTLRYWP